MSATTHCESTICYDLCGMRDRALAMLVRYQFYAADLDPCGHTTPCENGATCNNTGPDQYECLCAAGFEGDSCERETNQCDPNPCMNGGSCTVSSCFCGNLLMHNSDYPWRSIHQGFMDAC